MSRLAQSHSIPIPNVWGGRWLTQVEPGITYCPISQDQEGEGNTVQIWLLVGGPALYVEVGKGILR